jgi:hypothetical protein
MHSGRGEETPDGQYSPPPQVHEGVVLPSSGGPAWEPVPAAGQPWGPAGEQPQQFPVYPVSYAPQPDEGATQMFPPYPQASAPVGAADDTQFLPPYPQAPAPLPGALPPEAVAGPPAPPSAPFGIRPGTPDGIPGGIPDGATQLLPPYQQGAVPAGVADATQHLPRYEESQQQPPQDDFDHLYQRPDAPLPAQPPYQQPPQFQQQPPYQQQPPSPYEPGPPAARGRKKLSPAAVIGIVVGGCALVGLAAGAVLSSGSSGDSAAAGNGSAAPSSSASSSAGGASGEQAQARKLDALLKESGNSRSSVISAVASIKACQNLGQAATDLQNAATQRNDLVTRLGALSVDQLPDNQALTDALNKAWKASAAADTHYAAWAGEASGKGNVCKHGSARSTSETAAGNRESGTATQAKRTAVGLWNVIAKKYGLTQRQFIQL